MLSILRTSQCNSAYKQTKEEKSIHDKTNKQPRTNKMASKLGFSIREGMLETPADSRMLSCGELRSLMTQNSVGGRLPTS